MRCWRQSSCLCELVLYCTMLLSPLQRHLLAKVQLIAMCHNGLGENPVRMRMLFVFVFGYKALCLAISMTSKTVHLSNTPLASLQSVLWRTASVISKSTFCVKASAAPSLVPMAA